MTRVGSSPGDPPRVAFAIGRSVGNAVVRNRLRRRLRAVARAHANEFSAGHTYLIGASPVATGATYQELDAAFGALLVQTASSP
jgi:ribonuclease P protein component